MNIPLPPFEDSPMADRPAWVKNTPEQDTAITRHKCLCCMMTLPLDRLPLCERHWHNLDVEHGVTYETPYGRQFVPFTRPGELPLAMKFNPKQAVRYQRGVYTAP